MRDVVAYTLLSLDGVAETPDEFVYEFDEVMLANLSAVIGRQDAVLLGRRMYDEWAPYWPTGEDQPFADFINGVPKYVATSTPLATPWANTTAIKGDVVAFVTDLKAQEGGDIGVHGSIRLTQALLAADLVDRLQLVVTPVVTGAGRRLFDDLRPTRWELTASTASPTGSLLLDYRLRPRYPTVAG